MAGIYADIVNQLGGCFTTDEARYESDLRAQRKARQSGDTSLVVHRTLSRAVLGAVGLPRDVGALGYLRWREINAAVAALWAGLDAALDSMTAGAERRAREWSIRSGRTEEEVIDLLVAAEHRGDPPGLPDDLDELPGPCRPGSNPKKIGSMKRRWVLCAAAATYCAAEDAPAFTQLETAASGKLESISEWDLLAALDDLRPPEPDDGTFRLLSPWAELLQLWGSGDEATGVSWETLRLGQLLIRLTGGTDRSDSALAERIAAPPGLVGHSG